MAVYFTADTHFGHQNIIHHCNRPFPTVEQMDEALISRWNAIVGPHDEVWHLGDFTIRNGTPAQAYRERLNGEIHLVYGNHDKTTVKNLRCWKSHQAYAEIEIEDVSIVLCHYAMRVWRKSHHGSLMLYGHSHGNLPPHGNSLDVGVDCWNFEPITLSQILERLSPGRRPD